MLLFFYCYYAQKSKHEFQKIINSQDKYLTEGLRRLEPLFFKAILNQFEGSTPLKNLNSCYQIKLKDVL